MTRSIDAHPEAPPPEPSASLRARLVAALSAGTAAGPVAGSAAGTAAGTLAGSAADLVAASDHLDSLRREALRAAAQHGDDAPILLELAGTCRLRQRDIALRAYAAAELVAAERAFLRYVGLAPPNRSSGDIERPLAADPRYKHLARELLQTRVRALTGNSATAPPPCCVATTQLAAADRTGVFAITAPADRAARVDGDDAWILSPMDPTLGFVPCSYGCVAAQQARRATLARRDLRALRGALASRLLRLAPGVDLVLLGEPGRGAGTLKLAGLYAVLPAAAPPPLLRLLEALVVRRLLHAEVRFDGPAIDAKQGLVFVKMLHGETARYLDLT